MEMKIPEIPERVEPGCVRDYETVKQELESLAASHPDVVRLESIGRTAEGRDILMAVVGTGDRKVMIQCRAHAAEVTSTEAMMDYLQSVVKDPSKRSLLSGVTLLAIPMLSADAADLYAKTRHLIPGKLPEELLDLWQERARKFPLYYEELLDTFWGRNYNYANRATPHFFPLISSYKDLATGLTKYLSNFEDWLWIDALEPRWLLTGLYNPNRDNWQLILPETRARLYATLRYKPLCFLDLHGYSAYPLRPSKVAGSPTALAVRDGRLVYQLYAWPVSNPASYARDPDAALKGVFLGERFADPRYLRLSGLDLERKSMRGYQYPSVPEDQVEESTKVAKIVSQAAQDATGQNSAPVGYFHWNGLETPLYSSVAVACNPEFKAAAITCEVFGGHECGNIALDVCKPVYRAVIDSVLRYYAGLGGPVEWERFPVFQHPAEVVSKKEYQERRKVWDEEHGISGFKEKAGG
jgi:hypothetical protein